MVATTKPWRFWRRTKASQQKSTILLHYWAVCGSRSRGRDDRMATCFRSSSSTSKGPQSISTWTEHWWRGWCLCSSSDAPTDTCDSTTWALRHGGSAHCPTRTRPWHRSWSDTRGGRVWRGSNVICTFHQRRLADCIDLCAWTRCHTSTSWLEQPWACAPQRC